MKASVYKFSPDGIPMKLMHVYEQYDGSLTKAINFYQDSTLFLGGGYCIADNCISFAMKADTTGTVLKMKEVPLFGFPVAYSVLTPDNKIAALGERYPPGATHWETCLFKFNQDLEYDSTYTMPRTYDSLCPHLVNASATIYLDCEIVDTEKPLLKPEGIQLKIYPVPASERVTIALPEYYTEVEERNHIKTTTTWFSLKGNKTIEVYDLHGRLAASQPQPDGEQSLTVDVSSWAPGLYMARLVCKGKVWSQGKIVVAR